MAWHGRGASGRLLPSGPKGRSGRHHDPAGGGRRAGDRRGGRRVAALNPIYGRERILQLAEGLLRKFPLEPDAAWTRLTINGQPGFLITEREGLTTYAFDVDDGQITAVYVMRNPAKLRHLAG